MTYWKSAQASGISSYLIDFKCHNNSNRIIDHALSGLTKNQRETLKTASVNVDRHQASQESYMHGMQGKGDSKDMAARRSSDFINGNLGTAKQKQQEFKDKGGIGVSSEALEAFGNALHTITDMISPRHEGYQYWGDFSSKTPYDFISTGVPAVKHFFGEVEIDFYSQGLAAGATSKAYLDTFGRELHDQATGGLVLGSENDPTMRYIHHN